MGWWDERSPWAKAAAEQRALEARRARALEAIDLHTADRVAALLLRGEPVIDRSPAPHPTGVDAYTLAFLAEHGEKWGDHWTIFSIGKAEQEGDSDSLWVAWVHDLEWVVRRGDPKVYGRDAAQPSFGTIAHAMLEILLDEDELDALAADPGWEPDLALHPPPARGQVHEVLLYALDERSRVGRVVLTLVLGTMAAGIGYAGWLAITRGSPWGGLLGLAVALATIGMQLASILDVAIHEPRAFRLAPDREGIAHPSSGVRVRWEDVRSARLTWRTLEITFADGETARLPRSAFYAPRETATAIAARAGRGGAGAYRRS